MTGTVPDVAEDAITIVLADDHPVVRSGLKMLLEAEDDLEVVAEAGDTDSARRTVLGYKPGVLVLDLNMPGGSSLEAIPAHDRELAGDGDRGLDDAGGPGLRTRGAARRRQGLRAQAGGRHRARPGGARRGRRRHAG